MKTINKTRMLKRLVAFILAEFFLGAVLVWFFDPFYQYHSPFLGLDAVLNDRDNQMPGTIRNFQYDSVLVGSSVAENFDSSFLDAAYGCTTLKVIRSSGSVADLLYYLEQAEECRNLRNVFWCLDISAVMAPVEVSLSKETAPWYLHTKSPLDDLPYLYNKEIFLEKIPSMLACSFAGINTGGHAYDWSKGKTFSAEQAMRAYDRSAVVMEAEPEQKDYTEDLELISENIRLLTTQISAHPEIAYRFLIPPYSMLWWDCAYVNGELEERFYVLEQMVSALRQFDNVEIYYFQNKSEIVCNLNNYMDMIHYSPQVNQYMLEKMAAGENRITDGNWEDILIALREMVKDISENKIYEYYNIGIR